MIRFAAIPFAFWACAAVAQTPKTDARDSWFIQQGTRSLRPTGKQLPPVTVPHSYALVIGISHYKYLPDEKQLHFAEDDANSIYGLLISQEAGQFPAENVKKLIGPAATKANITRLIEEWLPSVSHDDDRVLIYFSGHGDLDERHKGYLIPYDADLNDIPGTSYDMDRLGTYFGSKIRAKWRVLLTDACHSGAITPAISAKETTDRLSSIDKSVFSLTASRDQEYSRESAQWGGGHGVFTYYVMLGLQGQADIDGDGVVRAWELAYYVNAQVNQATHFQQSPTADEGRFDREMVLAYHPPASGSAAALATGTLMIETDRDGVEVFVDNLAPYPVSKDQPLSLSGMQPGRHTVKGVHMGYEPDGPRDVLVTPDGTISVPMRIQTIRHYDAAAKKKNIEGMAAYKAGEKKNYLKAVQYFQQALTIDPKYSEAAMNLGSAYRSLFDLDNAEQSFKKAIEIDPDYADAHVRYGAMLLDRGDYDGAIVQLHDVLSVYPNRAEAHYLMSAVYRAKGAYENAVFEARAAVNLAPKIAESHFALAEALRYSKLCQDASAEYRQYLNMSNLDSGVGGTLGEWLLGIGKKKPSQQDIWKEQRNMANFGLCDCALMVKRPDEGIPYCKTALSYDAQDPLSHYRLGELLMAKYNSNGEKAPLLEARQHFSEMLRTSCEIDECANARKYTEEIDEILKKLK